MACGRDRQAGIVADGLVRAQAACEPLIRAEVAREFAPRLRGTPTWRRWLLRWLMEREVRRRLRRAAPPDGLY